MTPGQFCVRLGPFSATATDSSSGVGHGVLFALDGPTHRFAVVVATVRVDELPTTFADDAGDV